MPYINLKTTKKVTPAEGVQLKTAFGKAIECFPGKSEAFLMVGIEDSLQMWFRGNASADTAIVDVDLLGEVNSSASEKVTAEICKYINEILEISSERIYVKYTGYKDWGWNGGNF